MDDSLINPILLSSSVHLENVELVLRNLDDQSRRLEKRLSIDSLFRPDDLKYQDSGFTWDEQYDARANYCLTFSADQSKGNRFQPSSDETLIRLQRSRSTDSNDGPSPALDDQKNEWSLHSSVSWKQMTEEPSKSQLAPLNLYRIFQKKSSSRSPSSQTHSNTDQAIQTSIRFDSPSLLTNNHLLPPPTSSASHKSLPDLSFISQYSKELPRSRTTSPLPSSILAIRTTPSPIPLQPERPRTLKSIKRYKNSKHSTEPLGVFFSPQLRKTFAAVQSSAVVQGSDVPPAMIKMRLPVASSQPTFNRRCSEADLLQPLHSSSSACHPTIAVISEKDVSVHEEERKGTRRCQTDIIVVDPVLHRHSFTESPPNEFRLQEHDSSNMTTADDDHDLLAQSHVNIIPDAEQSVPNNTPDHQIVAPANGSRTPIDDFVERVHQVILRLFEIKRSDKAFFLNNEHNVQLDTLLKSDLCPAIQQILEHGLKFQGKESQTIKRTNIWKIIELSIHHGQVPAAYVEGKQLAQYVSSHWTHKFQAFIFALLNKSELVNWLYYFTRQKDLLQRYYQSPDAFILVSSATTFSQFERMMTQLEKLTPLAFRLTYHPPSMSSTLVNDPLQTSVLSTNSNRVSARDWIMTISRRNSKNLTQPIEPPAVTNETLRSTLSRRLNALFTKGTPSQLPKSPATSRRPRLSHVFHPTSNSNVRGVSENRLDFLDRSVSPSVRTSFFQSKIPRPSLNVDKPKSVRYRSAAPAPR